MADDTAVFLIDATSRPALPAGGVVSAGGEPDVELDGDANRACTFPGCETPVGSTDARVKRCPAHRESHKRKTPPSTPASGRVSSGRPAGRAPTETDEERKAKEALAKAKADAAKKREISSWLIAEANPVLVKGARRLLGIPEAWLDGPNGDGVVMMAMTSEGPQPLWSPSLRVQLSLSVKETEAIADVGVLLEGTQQGKFIAALLKNLGPYIAIGTSLWTIGGVAMRVTALRVQIVSVQEMVAQAQAAGPDPTEAMAAAQAAQNGAGPTPADLASMMAAAGGGDLP